jgi:hypothetical protein
VYILSLEVVSDLKVLAMVLVVAVVLEMEMALLK